MPEEDVAPQVDEKPTSQPDGAKPNGSEPEAAPEFDAWLLKQPADVQEAYKKHVAGLTSALDKERRANKKRDDEAARKAKEAEDAKLGEVEKRDKRIAQLEAERKELLDRQRMLDARDALMLAAEKSKVVFASQQAQQDAIKFALESAEFDEDGKIVKPEAALTEALKERQFLIKSAPPPPPTTNANDRGKSNGEVMDEARLKDIKTRYHIK